MSTLIAACGLCDQKQLAHLSATNGWEVTSRTTEESCATCGRALVLVETHTPARPSRWSRHPLAVRTRPSKPGDFVP